MSTPNPKVASARYTPDRRMAGTASNAPRGTTASPAPSSATGNGRPRPWARWENVVAPTAAKAAWHNEIWPDVHTSRASDRNIGTNTSAVEYSGRRGPAAAGRARQD